MLRAIGGTLRSVAGQIHSSRSALYRLASGKVLFPDTDAVLKLHRLAQRRTGVEVVPESDLRALLQRVLDEGEHAAAADNSIAEADRPALEEATGMGGGAQEGGTGAPAVAPVPPAEGDRRNERATGLQWPVDELVLHLDSGRYEHVVGMLDYAGDEAPALESAAAIQTCRSRGLAEVVDVLLRKVGGRPDRFVLDVVGHLMDAGGHADARELISRSAQAA
ncbi:hypothetical protein [Kitasatospora sp. SUK 42]|uniref:hypothetical protein n=1 Tax=Kitasatospora sp. SUK 42 TaxID=1588882 RepID=UPI0018CA2793|nr:hypothetical protein [Kitasatospora sp. SUK 42]MBV2152022.1 hypothetical protein [Kitasatospora sp. SUK 42]